MIERRYIDLKHELFDIYYGKLNDMQRESVYSVNGPNLILAGAGSGKTTVLVNRITHIIRYGNGYAVNFIPDDLTEETIGMIFQKSSTRTRVSFECGMYQLGGSALFLSSRDLQIGRGEPVEDTARVLSRYLDGIMIRTFEQAEVEALAEYGTIPVINGLSDYCHPCQVLADLQTVREHKGTTEGKKLCFIGDGNNMANSLIVGGIKTGMSVSVACPDSHRPDPGIMKWAAENGDFSCSSDILGEAAGADVVYTDVWASMGQESEAAERAKIFEGFQVNESVMAAAAPGAMVMHCLPAHRGEEITAEVFEAHANEIFDEAENRLHAQKAVLATLL